MNIFFSFKSTIRPLFLMLTCSLYNTRGLTRWNQNLSNHKAYQLKLLKVSILQPAARIQTRIMAPVDVLMSVGAEWLWSFKNATNFPSSVVRRIPLQEQLVLLEQYHLVLACVWLNVWPRYTATRLPRLVGMYVTSEIWFRKEKLNCRLFWNEKTVEVVTVIIMKAL